MRVDEYAPAFRLIKRESKYRTTYECEVCHSHINKGSRTFHMQRWHDRLITAGSVVRVKNSFFVATRFLNKTGVWHWRPRRFVHELEQDWAT